MPRLAVRGVAGQPARADGGERTRDLRAGADAARRRRRARRLRRVPPARVRGRERKGRLRPARHGRFQPLRLLPQDPPHGRRARAGRLREPRARAARSRGQGSTRRHPSRLRHGARRHVRVHGGVLLAVSRHELPLRGLPPGRRSRRGAPRSTPSRSGGDGRRRARTSASGPVRTATCPADGRRTSTASGSTSSRGRRCTARRPPSTAHAFPGTGTAFAKDALDVQVDQAVHAGRSAAAGHGRGDQPRRGALDPDRDVDEARGARRLGARRRPLAGRGACIAARDARRRRRPPARRSPPATGATRPASCSACSTERTGASPRTSGRRPPRPTSTTGASNRRRPGPSRWCSTSLRTRRTSSRSSRCASSTVGVPSRADPSRSRTSPALTMQPPELLWSRIVR